MATFADKFKKFILRVFRISKEHEYNIEREFSFQSNALKNSLWYDGDAYELSQFYQQTGNHNRSFWGSKESKGSEIRRIHTGLPALIVDTLVNITAKDIDNVNFEDEKCAKIWEELSKDISFMDEIAELTKTGLVIGDGGVKFTFDIDVSKTPKVEIVPGDRMEPIYQRGNLKELKFYTHYTVESKEYMLEETYGYGYIKYKLFNKAGHECELSVIPQTDGLEDIEFDSKIILAVPFKFFDSTKYKDRGKSIYEGKTDAFDALDECVSQWIDALRAGRVKTYIPEALIPRDPEAGYLLKPNAFDNRFVRIGNDRTDGAKNEIKTEQPDIRVEVYMQSYFAFVDMCIQGILAAATLGMDTKKLDNAEAQREKEKATLYTRAAIIESLEKVCKAIIQGYFDTLSIMHNTSRIEVEANVQFGEYANPSYDAVIDTLGKAYRDSLISTEWMVEEQWGDTKTPEEKAEEVQRIKNERGIVTLDEPAIGLEI